MPDKYIGLDIGGTKCAVILGDDKGNILEKTRLDTDLSVPAREYISRLLDEAAKYIDGVKAIGVSCGGPLDSRRGLVLSPPNLPGWDEIPITSMISERFSIPAALQNDANACALAEWRFGAGKGYDNVVFMTFGTGMGAGLVLDGRLYTGRNDNAGEIGHVRMSNLGGVGYGKLGSFEGICSGGGIAQLGRAKALECLQSGGSALYCRSMDELSAITAKSIADAALMGDETALMVYELVGEHLGMGMSMIMDILNPDVIVLGSIFARSRALLEPSMLRVIERETLPLGRCEVVPALLGEAIGDIAALCTAMSAVKGA